MVRRAAPPQRYSHVNLQPLTRPRRARLAGAGAARSSARLASSWWEWCTSLRVETSLEFFSRITTKHKLRMKIINVPVILADESLFDIVVIIGKARNCTPEQSTPCNSICFIILRQLNFRLNTIPQRRGGPGVRPLSRFEGTRWLTV